MKRKTESLELPFTGGATASIGVSAGPSSSTESDALVTMGPDGIPSGGASFGPPGPGPKTYRYRLWREWGDGRKRVLWLMLNPSTADASKNDPTITRCIEFSKRWGFESLEVCNLFAFRATDPSGLLIATDPIGPGNADALVVAAGLCRRIVCAWGAHGSLHGRDAEVRERLKLLTSFANPPDVVCLGLTQDGHPKHPLARGKAFVPYTFTPIPYPLEAP